MELHQHPDFFSLFLLGGDVVVSVVENRWQHDDNDDDDGSSRFTKEGKESKSQYSVLLARGQTVLFF